MMQSACGVSMFSLLHITDLHIATEPTENELGQRSLFRALDSVIPSRANLYALEAVAKFLAARRGEIDLVMITGDVSDDGLQRNLNVAHRFISTPATDDWFFRPFSPTLDSGRQGRAGFLVMPGNHDRFRPVGRLPGGTGFDDTFSDFWSTGIGGVQSIVLNGPGNPLAVVAADFCLRTGHLGSVYLGQGCAYADVVDKLKQETYAVRHTHPNAGVVWISHFPPLMDVDHKLRLLASEGVLIAAQEAGVRYIIAGHLHRNQINTYADVNVICTGTATSKGIGELRGFWLQRFDIEVRSDGEIAMHVISYRYRAVETAFVEQRPAIRV